MPKLYSPSWVAHLKPSLSKSSADLSDSAPRCGLPISCARPVVVGSPPEAFDPPPAAGGGDRSPPTVGVPAPPSVPAGVDTTPTAPTPLPPSTGAVPGGGEGGTMGGVCAAATPGQLASIQTSKAGVTRSSARVIGIRALGCPPQVPDRSGLRNPQDRHYPPYRLDRSANFED